MIKQLISRGSIEGAIFDLDGTLFDSLGVWEKIDRAFLWDRHIDMPPDYMDEVASMEFIDAARYTVERFRLNDAPEALVLRWRDMAAKEYGSNIHLKAGAMALLLWLKKQGIKLGVVTSLPQSLCGPVLNNNGVAGFFSGVVTTGGSGLAKTGAEIYVAGAKAIGAMPARCLYFDDLPENIKGAKKAGMQACGVFDPYNGCLQEELKAISDYYLTDFSNCL